jgi:glutamyl-tRNA(Gln) amidotransferase subunit E
VASRRFSATSSPPSPHDLNPRSDPPLDFPDRALEELAPADYAELGFLCGLEVHQQLSTRRKLFCRCPAGKRVTRVDAEVLRHMRPTLSEMGEYDGCALMEFKTQKEIVYLLERGTVCTYEMDDTPPFEIDDEAIKVSLEMGMLLGLNLVNELQVMRKQYLDGSIPTGFQRTAMVGTGAVIPFHESELGPDRMLRIRQLTLEEDSCREVSDVGHRITFRTDRLGTPLIETVTEPDLLTPLDVRAGGRLLADVAHATGKVRRGAGAARQDVNVSVAGGRRVELKGVPNHRVLPRLVHNEAFRQLNLLRIRAELLRRGVTHAALALGEASPAWESKLAIDARTVLRKSGYPPVRDALERGDMIGAVQLPGFGGLLVHPTQPGITFARELADRVQVIACLEARPFMISSSVSDYGLGPADWRHLRNALGAAPEDGLVVVWGPAADVDTAIREILIRAGEALDGVPSETRQPFADGTTGFERILPGAERMYPDTDTPPIRIPDAWVHQIEVRLEERPWQRADRYAALGLSAERSWRLARSPWARLFDELAGGLGGAIASQLAVALGRTLPRTQRRRPRAAPVADRLRPIVIALASGALPAFALEPAILRVLDEPQTPSDHIVREFSSGDPQSCLDERLVDVAAARAEVRSSDPEAVLRWGMGRLLGPVRGKLDPRVARAALVTTLAETDPGGSAP